MRGKIFVIVILLILFMMLVPYLPWLQPTNTRQAQIDNTSPDTLREEIDSDGDLLIDDDEYYITNTDPFNPDTDSDGMIDGEEYKYWSDRYDKAKAERTPNWLEELFPYLTDKERKGLYSPTGDLDGDGLPNMNDKDSDNDGLSDGFESEFGLDPSDPDDNYDSLPSYLQNYLKSNKVAGNMLNQFPEYMDLNDRDGMDFSDTDFNKDLFTVSPATNPRYWRTTVFDRYENGRWYSTSTNPTINYKGNDLNLDVDEYISKESYTYNVTFNGLIIGMLPTALHTTSVYSTTPTSEIKYSTVGTFESLDYIKSYMFNATVFEYNDLVLKSANAPSEIDNNYIVHHQYIHKQIQDLGREITAGKGSDFEKASSIASYLTSNYIYDLHSYRYNLDYPLTDNKHTFNNNYDIVLVNMLTQTYRGHCVDFASAFVLMCRSSGIPAQLVTGFAPGDIDYRNINQRTVKLGHNHAWAEVLLEDVGWIPFEVTPGRAIFGNTTGVPSSGEDPNIITNPTPFDENGTEYEWGGEGGGTTTKNFIDFQELINDPKLDTDHDGLKNDKDDDDDNDGLKDEVELELGTNPFNKDTDKDSLSDYYEVEELGTSPLKEDSDYDGLTDYYEDKKSKTDPLDPDTDNGGANDGIEVFNDGDPLDNRDDDKFIDTDHDGLTNAEEEDLGTDPFKKDTDGGGADDKLENLAGLDPVDDPKDDLRVLDSDSDGLMDSKEEEVGSDRFKKDSDQGGINDGVEYKVDKNNNYGLSFDLMNSSDDYWLKDNDGDGLMNFYEDELGTDQNNSDTDYGGVSDTDEHRFGTDPLDNTDDYKVDSDGDGISNIDEDDYDTSPYKKDTDNDGLSDWEEIYKYGTDPTNADTDGDGLYDGFEPGIGTDPSDWDSDDDGLNDLEEIMWYTDPNNKDTDQDGLADGDEVIKYNSNPILLDSDGDGLVDRLEVDYDSDPMKWDTDGDGFNDWEEIDWGTNPDKKYDFPDTGNDPSDDFITPDPKIDPPSPDEPGYDPDAYDPPTSTPDINGPGSGGGDFGGGSLGAIWPVILGIILIIIIGLYYISWRHQHIEEIAEVAERAEKELSKISDPREFDNIRLAIFEAYRSMLKVMQRYDFVREPSMTPSEFKLVIANALPISDRNINSLTKLFEEARYSDHKLSTRTKDRAIESFRELKDELRGVSRFKVAS